jgi:hypothetical protein
MYKKRIRLINIMLFNNKKKPKYWEFDLTYYTLNRAIKFHNVKNWYV